MKATFCFVILSVLYLCVPSEGAASPCTYKGVKWEKGETVPAPIGECARMHCEDPATNSIGFVGCAAFQAPHCKIQDEDLTKPYPECCSKPICD